MQRGSANDQGRGMDPRAGRALVFAALDIGQSKVSCFIMKPDGVRHADRTIRVAGASHVQSKGVRGGAIINMDEAAQAIGHAVERAERAAQSPVSGVVVTTAIGQMASHRVQARVSLGASPVGDADLARAVCPTVGPSTSCPSPGQWTGRAASTIRARCAAGRWGWIFWSSPWPRMCSRP